MYSLKQRKEIVNKIESNRNDYEMIGEYEDHQPVLCLFTDKPVVHVDNEITEGEKLPIGWAVNVTLSNGEVITCIAAHNSYDEEDIAEDYLVIE